jgi:hypothetical protein
VNPSIVFPIIAAVISVGGIFIAIGVFKGKIHHNTEDIAAQQGEIKNLATKDDLAAAISRSDEMLEIMRKRAEEDRAKGHGQWREFYDIVAKHSERIGVLENQQNTLMKSLDEIKGDIKSGFRQLQDELKELRNLR